jgi:hypothetical protein
VEQEKQIKVYGKRQVNLKRKNKMKQQLNEVKKLQKIAGIINENQAVIDFSGIGSNKESRAIGMWAQSKGLSQEDFDELDMLLEDWFNITQYERDDSRSM